MKKYLIGTIVIFAVWGLSACSKDEVMNTVKNAENVVVSGANNLVSEVSNMITYADSETNSATETVDSISETSSPPTNQSTQTPKPDLEQIRNMCKLATVKCCFNNVARSYKEPGEGISHMGEKKRVFWIEYSGHFDIGIDLSEVKMEIEEEKITITIPRAKILNEISIDTYNDDDIYEDKDQWIQKNKITSEDKSKAISQANVQLIEEYNNNSSLFIYAQNRAKQLIENYIKQIGTATNVKYDIEWVYE